jgi:hypothetical protein
LTKNWTDNFQQNFQLPETVNEAVDRLMLILNGEQKIALAGMQEEDLSNLHFSLGMAIRNAFELHEPGSKLLASCCVAHPEDASGVIVKALWDKLMGTENTI